MDIPLAPAIDSFLSNLSLPSLSEFQIQDLNLPFTELEINQAINSLPSGKSPAPDGYY